MQDSAWTSVIRLLSSHCSDRASGSRSKDETAFRLPRKYSTYIRVLYRSTGFHDGLLI